jgi:hypothetical protein
MTMKRVTVVFEVEWPSEMGSEDDLRLDTEEVVRESIGEIGWGPLSNVVVKVELA